jgi:hypothetical protein
MAQTPAFPGKIAQAVDYSASTKGIGREKSNDKSVNDWAKNFVAEEWNQIAQELIATQTAVGITGSADTSSHEYKIAALESDMSTAQSDITAAESDIDALEDLVGDGGYPPVYGDADEYNIRERLNYGMSGLQQCGFIETTHIDSANLDGAAVGLCCVGIGGAWSLVASPDDDAATVIKCVVADNTTHTMYHATTSFQMDSCYFGCRIQQDALTTQDGDVYRIGLYRDGNNKVWFESTRAGGAWPNWDVVVVNAGASWSDTLTTGNPADLTGGWVTFEIVCTSSGAYFFYQRSKSAHEEMDSVGAQAPAGSAAYPRITLDDALGGSGGGEEIYVSGLSCVDTRNLWSV